MRTGWRVLFGLAAAGAAVVAALVAVPGRGPLVSPLFAALFGVVAAGTATAAVMLVRGVSRDADTAPLERNALRLIALAGLLLVGMVVALATTGGWTN